MAAKDTKPDQPARHGIDSDERDVEIDGITVHEHVRHRPTKGDPVVRAGDAGGPNDGRNITTADLDQDSGKPEPNVLEQNAYSGPKPRGGKERG